MAKSLTLIHKITKAVQNIGKINGTKIADADPPSDIKGNEARSRWIDEYNALAEHFVASTAQKVAKDRLDKAKDALDATFGDTISKIAIGTSVTITRGSYSTLFNRRNGARRINRASVINTLTAAPYNWKLDDINTFLDKIDLAPPDGAMYITPSTTQE